MKGDSVKTKSSAELRAMRDARPAAAQSDARRPGAIAPVKTRRQQLDDYKGVVDRRQRDFVEIGTALGLIRKEGLFEEDGYRSFEEFVEREFDMTRSYAYRLVDAARVISILSPMATLEEPGSKIKNEAQARQLVPLGKDRAAMLAVLAAAEKRGERLTAAALADARDELYPDKKIIDGDIVRPKPAVVAGMRKAITDVASKNSPTDPTTASDRPAKVDNGELSGQTGPSGDADRAASPDAGASVGAGVAYDAPQTSVILCPVPRDLDYCGICGNELAEKNGGYLRCPNCDRRQEHIAEALLDGSWGECRLCTKTSAAVTAANTEDASLALGEPADTDQAAVSAGIQTAAEGLTHPEADGGEAVSIPFHADDPPAPTGDDAASPPPVGVTHEQENGWAGPNGDCGASCTCGVMFDGFDTIGEARALLDAHIANPEERDEDEVHLASMFRPRGAPDCYAVGAVEAVTTSTCPTCEAWLLTEDGSEWIDRWNRRWTTTDTPAAATTSLPDGEGHPMPEQSQQPGQDSPTGREGGRSETDTPVGPDHPVATTVLPGIDHHQVSGVFPGGDEAPVSVLSGPAAGYADAREPVELEGGGDASLPSSSDPDELMNAFGVLVHFLDNADLDAIGPLLLGEDMETLHSHVDAIAAYVGKLGRARFGEMLHTP